MDRLPAHAMTCDVEDYFQVSAFDGIIPREEWDRVECRIPQNVDRALQLLEDHGAKATFFTLGWVARRHPEVVRRIAEAGHEVASHGMDHTRVWSQRPEEFLEDARTSRELLEDLCGCAVTGYRAASWSVDSRTPWAHDLLAEAGYMYSSSIYPITHDHFGMPDAPGQPFAAGSSGILEIPASTATIFGRKVPVGGGGYFRLYPLAVSKFLIRRHSAKESHPYLFYFHPWELDPDQPRVPTASAKSKFRHYLNLHRFEARWKSLLEEFSWNRMDEIYLGPGR